jgi:IrrE N-terminal-like domain
MERVMECHSRIESQIVHAVLRTPPEPPVELLEIARSIGVDAIHATEFPDGFTDFRSNRPVIFLNRTECGPRMRFILAHEIAHVILRMPEARYILEVSGHARLLHDEEGLADRIAAAILIPDSWISALRKDEVTLTGLEDIARQADVPLTVLIDRMSLANIKVGLLHWWRGNYSWHIVDRPGAPDCLHGHFALSENGRVKFEHLRNVESIVTVDGHVDGRYVEITGPSYRRGGEVFQLITPLCTTWFVASTAVAIWGWTCGGARFDRVNRAGPGWRGDCDRCGA